MKFAQSRWLVVDDEPGLSEIMADVLTDLGLARVENFTSAAAALGTFTARRGGYNLVVTDRDMPGLDGLELSRRLREQDPDVRVILMSAHTDDVSQDDLRRAGVDAVVRKPFRLAELEAAARGVVYPLPAPVVAGIGALARAA